MKYLLLLAGDERWTARPQEEIECEIQAHQALEAELRTRNAFYDGGGLAPCADARTVQSDGTGNVVVTDGPFVETKEFIGGYYSIEADSMEDALAVAKRIPLPTGAKIEVRAVHFTS